MSEASFWVYILHCENNSYYIGYTTDLMRRYQEHLKGTEACKYTRSFKPRHIAQYWQIKGEKAEAMRVECYLKRCSKAEKQRYIEYPQLLVNVFKNGLVVEGAAEWTSGTSSE